MSSGESHSVFVLILTLHGLVLVLPLLQGPQRQPADRQHPRQPGEPQEPVDAVSAAPLPLLLPVVLDEGL